jgi:hypothetical protein
METVCGPEVFRRAARRAAEIAKAIVALRAAAAPCRRGHRRDVRRSPVTRADSIEDMLISAGTAAALGASTGPASASCRFPSHPGGAGRVHTRLRDRAEPARRHRRRDHWSTAFRASTTAGPTPPPLPRSLTSTRCCSRPPGTERLAAAGVSGPPGTAGDCDNALAESVIGLFKTELIKPRGLWRTAEQVELAALEYVDWFSHGGSTRPAGDSPPADIGATYYRQNAALTRPAR